MEASIACREAGSACDESRLVLPIAAFLGGWDRFQDWWNEELRNNRDPRAAASNIPQHVGLHICAGRYPMHHLATPRAAFPRIDGPMTGWSKLCPDREEGVPAARLPGGGEIWREQEEDEYQAYSDTNDAGLMAPWVWWT